MLALIIVVALFWLFWKVFLFGIRVAFGITTILMTLVLIPLVALVLACIGVVYLAIPLLVIVAIVALLGGIIKRV